MMISKISKRWTRPWEARGSVRVDRISQCDVGLQFACTSLIRSMTFFHASVPPEALSRFGINPKKGRCHAREVRCRSWLALATDGDMEDCSAEPCKRDFCNGSEHSSLSSLSRSVERHKGKNSEVNSSIREHLVFTGRCTKN